MKDVADNKTTDLFPAPKRPRGRPSTGQAKTNAQRQADYRHKKRHEGGTFGKSNLNLWVSTETKYALERIARYKDRTSDQILRMLIEAEEQRITKDMELYGDDFNRYYHVD